MRQLESHSPHPNVGSQYGRRRNRARFRSDRIERLFCDVGARHRIRAPRAPSARADGGSHGARIALELSDDPTRFLSTVQIGITLIGILAGAFSGATIAEKFAARLIDYGVSQNAAEPLAIALVALVLTYLSLVIGELVPKRFALAHADAIASHVAPAIKLIARVTHPVGTLLQLSTEGALRLLGIRGHGRSAVTDEEVNALIAEGRQQGVIHPAEQAMVQEVLQLADRPVRTVMTHRRDVVWLDIADTADGIRHKIADAGYSRFLICDGALDNFLGCVRTRAIVDRLLSGGPLDLRAMLREPVVISPSSVRSSSWQCFGAHGRISPWSRMSTVRCKAS